MILEGFCRRHCAHEPDFIHCFLGVGTCCYKVSRELLQSFELHAQLLTQICLKASLYMASWLSLDSMRHGTFLHACSCSNLFEPRVPGMSSWSQQTGMMWEELITISLVITCRFRFRGCPTSSQAANYFCGGVQSINGSQLLAKLSFDDGCRHTHSFLQSRYALF